MPLEVSDEFQSIAETLEEIRTEEKTEAEAYQDLIRGQHLAIVMARQFLGVKPLSEETYARIGKDKSPF